MRNALVALIALVGLGVPSVASATTWTLPTLSFAEGGTVSGSIVTDVSGNLVGWDITTTTSGTYSGAHYTPVTSSLAGFVGSGHNDFYIWLNGNTQYVEISMAHDIAAPSPNTVIYVQNPYYNPSFYQNRLAMGGGQQAVAATPAPEPISAALLAGGLGGLAIIRRRRRA